MATFLALAGTTFKCRVLRGERPTLVLSGGALARAQSLLASDHHLSLTHDAGMAMAFVVMEARA